MNDLIPMQPQTNTVAQYAQSLILAGEYCAYQRHDHKKAIRLFERAYIAAGRAKNIDLEFRSLFQLIQSSFAAEKHSAILANGGKAEYLAIKTKNYGELAHILRIKAQVLATFGFCQESARELDRAKRFAEFAADDNPGLSG
ncbi:hypothetical protein ACFQRK_19195 [Parapedobacter sp. GCM10030251]|uniref:hypothetical protein n=1 Tax=Parapedobacter sp. GCM10030251 TaxID=3273419 RepID=UPI0036241984